MRALIYSLIAAAGGGALGVAAWPAQQSAAAQPATAQVRMIAAYAMPSAGPVAAVAGGRELECLTQAVYFEARGESAQGQAAVAQVIMNRVRHPAFPKTVCAVVYQGAGSRGCQFSFACDGAAERAHEMGAWSRARRIAARALAGAVAPQVAGATHFHALQVSPNWGPRMLRVAQVGAHVFYRFGAPVRAAIAPAKVMLVNATAAEAAVPVATDEAPAAETSASETAPEAVVHAEPARVETAAGAPDAG